MSKQTVTLRVPVDDDWDAEDRVQVYTDFGSGMIDMTRPLLSRQRDVFPGQHHARGFGEQPFGVGRFSDFKAERPVSGFEQTPFGVAPFGTPGPFVELTVDVDAAHGKWKFAVKAVDRDGTVQGGALQETSVVVSGTDPPPLARFAFNGYDGVNDQAIFDIEPGTD